MKKKRGRPFKKPEDKVVRFVIYLSPYGAKRLLSLKGWQWEDDTTGVNL